MVRRLVAALNATRIPAFSKLVEVNGTVELEGAFAELVAAFGGLDILYNNAGGATARLSPTPIDVIRINRSTPAAFAPSIAWMLPTESTS